MIRRKLTGPIIKKALDEAVAAGSNARLGDTTPRLDLKIFGKSGVASWTFCYRPKGSTSKDPERTITIGRWPGVTPEAARDAAQKYMGERAQGLDPAAELRRNRVREKNRLDAVLDRYEAELGDRKLVKKATAMSSLRRGLKPLMAREVDLIETKDLVAQIEKLEKAGKPGAAADLRKFSKGLFDQCRLWGLVQFNPLAGLVRSRKTRAQTLEDGEKGRALDDAEIVRIWAACRDLGAFGSLVRLGLLTGLRRGELASLTWSNIKKDRLIVEAHVAKTGRRHEVPLTPAMRAVLPARGTSDLVFVSSRREKPTPLSGWTQMLAALRVKAGFEPATKGSRPEDFFSMHDLRRTARTLMSRLGVSEDVAELAIGHVKASLIAKYDKDQAWPGRVDAFEKVSTHIAGLVADGGENVVALRAAG